MRLSDISIHAFIQENNIKTESGTLLDFKDHMFMFDIYRDFTPIQALMKGAQITASTCFSLKVPWVMRRYGIDAIYTLPTEGDRNSFVSGKVNRMIAQNPILQEWTRDKDSIEQKQIVNNLIHFRGTFTQKSAIMVPSDLNIYDEIDASKESVIEQYGTRLQHSKYQWEWYLSHPSTEGYGIHRMFQKSDQKHWFITCPHCASQHYIRWPESICTVRKIYQCIDCKKEITNDTRRRGSWIKKYPNRTISGYWIPLLICPWVPASKILEYFHEKTPDYFYNKVLGLPYVGKGNKLTKALLYRNLTQEVLIPPDTERIVIGIDTGLKLDYVMGGRNGLFFHGECDTYQALDKHMKDYPKAIAFIDGGGDLIGSREFQKRHSGRVFLCFLTGDRKATDEPTWNEAEKMVTVDRNKYIQMVVDEFSQGKIPLQGTEDDWYEYFLDWNNLTRTKIVDSKTEEFKGHKWIRSGRDHRALATVFWRVGMTRFGQGHGKLIEGGLPSFPLGHAVMEGNTITRKLHFEEQDDNDDWRITN